MGLRTLGPAAALLVAASGAAAQTTTTVRSARMVADLAPDDGAAEVRIEYVLDVAGPSELRFELLGFGDADAPGFWLGARDTGIPVTLERETGSMRSAEFTMSLAEGTEEHRFEVHYLIRDAVAREGESLVAHVPVLVVAAPPSPEVIPAFEVEVLVPEAWRVSEGFPSGLTRSEPGRWGVDLAVVPSVVSLRARADGVWRPGLPLLLDVLALGILLGFGWVGWRHLSAVAGRAARRAPGA